MDLSSHLSDTYCPPVILPRQSLLMFFRGSFVYASIVGFPLALLNYVAIFSQVFLYAFSYLNLETKLWSGVFFVPIFQMHRLLNDLSNYSVRKWQSHSLYLGKYIYCREFLLTVTFTGPWNKERNAFLILHFSTKL
jgi:hypothetical protein